jgi:hypothetical protein
VDGVSLTRKIREADRFREQFDRIIKKGAGFQDFAPWPGVVSSPTDIRKNVGLDNSPSTGGRGLGGGG